MPAPSAFERIRTLALEELERAPAARPWWKDAAILAAVNAVVAVGCVFALGRKGLVFNQAAPAVLIAVAVPVLLTALLGAVAAVIPGRPARIANALVLALLATAAILLGRSGYGDQRPFLLQGMPCMTSELAMSILPVVAAVFVLSRFAYSRIRMFLGGLAAGAAGLFALHLHCPIGTASHLAVFHVLPWIAAAAVAVLIRSRVRSRTHAP